MTDSIWGVNCLWERYRDTGAPMRSQQRQIALCTCTPCRAARVVKAAIIKSPIDMKASTAARVKVLEWKPEPPAPPPDDAA